MARRIVERNAVSLDREILQVLVIYEEGVSKQDIRKENPYSKKHGVLYKASGNYEFKGLAANKVIGVERERRGDCS